MGQPPHISPDCGLKPGLGDLASQLPEWGVTVNRLSERVTGVGPSVSTKMSSRLSWVSFIMKLRQTRQTIFGEGLFGEPAWDIFLQLYSSALQGNEECVSSLCVASGMPSTTALRWIRLLERGGWIERYADPLDGRRTFVKLSHKGLEAMDTFFAHPYFAERVCQR